MKELIITEKPSSASKIAAALSDSKPVKKNYKKVPYYELSHNNQDIIVCPAVGHLFKLDQKEGTKKWTYPVFDIEWHESGDTKHTKYIKPYIQNIKKLAKEATSFTIATDYDVEGELIGLNIVRYLCKQKDASRMKYSTLTKQDLIKSYETKFNTLNWGQAIAGDTRHHLDWMYGINLSRALTLAIKQATNSFKLLTIGRVQGPALKIIVDKEKLIRDFVPVPYWQIRLLGLIQGAEIESWHVKDKFWEQEEANKVYDKVKDQKTGTVEDIKKREFNQSAPTPFDLTSLQTEAYRVFKYSPKKTLDLAQTLYTAGIISYPRTSSQKLPHELGFKNILKKLGGQDVYKETTAKLLQLSKLQPNNGKKDDPAHPAIYPTGTSPDNSMSSEALKVYDLVVKRFMATFGEPATRETVTVTIDVNSEKFAAKGTYTKKKGWHEFYQPYVLQEESNLTYVEDGSEISINKIELLDKETQPPKRYTPASIIKELEKRNLGTKATRSEIVETLYKRNYVENKEITATQLGIDMIDVLSQYSPKIIEEELTKHFEDEMEEIFYNRKTEDAVLAEARDVLTKILEDFKQKEVQIGKELAESNRKTQDEQNTIGPCPVCRQGTLMIKKGKYGRFIACSKYPDCTATFKIPPTGTIKATGKECDSCGYPTIKIIQKGKVQNICINPDCSTKQLSAEEQKNSEQQESKTCPACKKGKMVLRKSMYGAFLGCDRYPKCKHTIKLNGDNNKNGS